MWVFWRKTAVYVGIRSTFELLKDTHSSPIRAYVSILKKNGRVINRCYCVPNSFFLSLCHKMCFFIPCRVITSYSRLGDQPFQNWRKQCQRFGKMSMDMFSTKTKSMVSGCCWMARIVGQHQVLLYVLLYIRGAHYHYVTPVGLRKNGPKSNRDHNN